MNPFLEIPVCLDGGNKLPEKTVQGRVLPGEIAFHYPGYSWGAVVILKSGYTFLTTMSCEEIDVARQAYAEILYKKPGVKNNIVLQQKPSSHVTS